MDGYQKALCKVLYIIAIMKNPAVGFSSYRRIRRLMSKLCDGYK